MNTFHREFYSHYKYTDYWSVVKNKVNYFHVDKYSLSSILNPMKTIGERIRARRKEVGLTAEELAKLAGIDRTYLSKMERHNVLPSPRIFTKIIIQLKVRPESYLLEYQRLKFPDLYKRG